MNELSFRVKMRDFSVGRVSWSIDKKNKGTLDMIRRYDITRRTMDDQRRGCRSS